MHDQNMWKQFEKTGMITDYLNYKSCEYSGQDKKEQTGESGYGTKYHCYGNDIVSGICG